MYDFVVVGAGPAGCRFARRTAADGHDVLVLEAGQVGSPLACSGHVSTDLWDYTPAGTRDEILQNEIVGARFHAGGPETTAHPFYRDEVVSNVIDRVALDRHLAEAARDAGATIRTEHAVTDVDTREPTDRVAVTASTPDGERTFEGRFVAGCDGPTSRVRRELGLAEPAEILHGVLGFDPTPDDGDYVDVFTHVPGFFAWRIPRGDAGVEYGLAARPSADVGDLFDDLLSAHGVRIERRCSGGIPIGPPSSVTTDRGFLVGDAAAHNKPFTGGGILYGLRAADHAARVVDPSDPETLEAYEETWREDLSRDIALGRLVRRAYDLPRPIRSLGLGVLSGPIGVHMDRPSSVLSRDNLLTMAGRRETAGRRTGR